MSTAPRVTPDSSPRRLPDLVWVPVATGLLMLAPALAGLATGQVLLFPSLGPTALLQTHTPTHPSTRPYNVVVSHLLGLACGLGAVLAFGLATAPSVFEAHALSPARVGASVLAIVVAALLELVLHASHPPAASTTLLVALGTFKPNMRDVTSVVVGVLIVAALGEVARRVRLAGMDRTEARAS